MDWKDHLDQMLKAYRTELDRDNPDGEPPFGQVGLDPEQWLVQSSNILFLLEEFKPKPSPCLDGHGGTVSGIGGPLPERLGRFQILGELGRGGGGIVLLARDPFRGEKVALKVPRPEILIEPRGRRRFLREARVMEGLNHPAIVRVYEIGQIGPICYIVSSYSECTDLAHWLRDHDEPIDPRAAALLIATVADGLAHAHGRGIFHRDIKPSNILLFPEPGGCAGLGVVPKLTDFGLAKLSEGDPEDDSKSGTVVGTARYMAPEQAEAVRGSVGPQLDVYSLGAVLYEMLVRSPHFEVKTVSELRSRLGKGSIIPPRHLRPDIPRDLETIVLNCLEKDRRDRCPHMDHLSRNLRLFAEGRRIELRPASLVRRLWTRSRHILSRRK